MTEPNKTVDLLRKTNRALKVISRCSQIIMSRNDEKEIFQDICQIIVEIGGYRLAWIGLRQQDEIKSVTPVAYSGVEDGYLDKINISWEDNERGRGPTGTAIRTHKPSICRNILNDPNFLPWRNDAINRGYASSTSIPLISEEEVLGALNVYSTNYNAFDSEEIELLEEIANVLSFGIKSRRKFKSAELKLLKSKESAEKATKLKDKFISLVAHDLRSPLSSILGLIEIMKKDSDGHLNVKHKRYIDLIQNNGKDLISFVDELLNVSRLQSGNLIPSFRFVDGHTIASNVSSKLNNMGLKKGISIEVHVPFRTRLYADRDLFTQVIQNLVSNAIKFSNSGDVITIFVPFDQPSTLAVKDQGVGINQEMISKLFLFEERTSSIGTAGEKGSGLGLPLSMEIMESHNGTIKVESKIDETIFYAQLPYVKPIILIVDDDPSIHIIFEEYLSNLGVEIISADNGLKALNLVIEKKPHLIITDIIMPVMDGFAFLEKAKTLPGTSNTPIIVMTSDNRVETRNKAFFLKANDFIQKPIMGDISSRIQKIVV